MAASKKSKIRGFVLVDVLIGVVILMVALLAIGGLYIQSGHAIAFADNRTVAINWAKARVEEMQTTYYWRGASGGDDPFVPADNGNENPPRAGFSRQTTVKLANVAASDLDFNMLDMTNTTKSQSQIIREINDRLILVTVTVSWNEKGQAQFVQVRTYIDRK